MSECKFCGSTEDELRRRRIANGSIQYMRQCLKCGRAKSNALRASTLNNPDSLPPWDEDKEGQFLRFSEQQYLQKKATKKAKFFAEHDAYLTSAKWRVIRARVLKRAGGICEGCGIEKATQVHHKTYDHWQDEFLWELVAICDDCHERVHTKQADET